MSQNAVFIYYFFAWGSHKCFFSLEDMPNGIVPENSLPLPDRRAGKKHKRHKNSPRMVDAKFESVSLEKENTEDTHTDDHSREQAKLHNNQDAKNG